MQFVSGGVNTISIVGVHNEDETMCILIVMSPKRANLVLSPYVPDGEANILVFDSFDVESDSGNGCYNFSQLKFIEDGGLFADKPTKEKRVEY